jgi:hypothetical protein
MKFMELKIKLIVATRLHGSNPEDQGKSESVSLLSQVWLIVGESRSGVVRSVVHIVCNFAVQVGLFRTLLYEIAPPYVPFASL